MPAKQSYAERLWTAAKAKKAQLESYAANGPQSTARQAAQAQAAAARTIRTAERKKCDREGAQQREALRAAACARQARAVVDEKTRMPNVRPNALPRQRPMPL